MPHFTAEVQVARNVVDGKPFVRGTSWFYGAEDPADQGAVPDPARNNVVVELRRFIAGTVDHVHASADDQSYLNKDPAAVYILEPQWRVEPEVVYFIRFVPAFDKRDTPDQHCSADTAIFAMPRAGIS